MDGEDIGFPIVLCFVVLCFVGIVLLPLTLIGVSLWTAKHSHDSPQTAPDGSVLCKHGVSLNERNAARQRLIAKGIVSEDRWSNEESKQG